MRSTVKAWKIAATATATVAVLPFAAVAHADAPLEFASPSGNIACILDAAQAVCDVVDFTWVMPPRPADCHVPHGPVFYLPLKAEPGLDQCHPGNAGINVMPGLQTLGYGQTRSLGAITCDSEPSGMTCTDASSGHFFSVSRSSYQLG